MLQSNLAFRAQLVIPEQRELYDYWLQSCGENDMPSRRQIAPRGMKPLLPHVSLIDVDREKDRLKVRLAGTGLRDIYDQDITGSFLNDLPFINENPLKRVIDRGLPGQGVNALKVTGKENIVQFWLRLPLSEDGSLVNMVLGFDVFMPADKAVALTQAYATAQAS